MSPTNAHTFFRPSSVDDKYPTVLPSWSVGDSGWCKVAPLPETPKVTVIPWIGLSSSSLRLTVIVALSLPLAAIGEAALIDDKCTSIGRCSAVAVNSTGEPSRTPPCHWPVTRIRLSSGSVPKVKNADACPKLSVSTERMVSPSNVPRPWITSKVTEWSETALPKVSLTATTSGWDNLALIYPVCPSPEIWLRVLGCSGRALAVNVRTGKVWFSRVTSTTLLLVPAAVPRVHWQHAFPEAFV